MQCERCGAIAEKGQRKYCKACSKEVNREWWEIQNKKKRERRQKAEHANQFIDEVKICLNCKRGRCHNCLDTMSFKEKQELLAKVESEIRYG